MDAEDGELLSTISAMNRSRCDKWHADGEPWSGADWGNALAGEVGELCNVIKKVRRWETGASRAYNTPNMLTLNQMLAEEIADVFLYLDLVAYHFGLDLYPVIRRKFNDVSEIQGFPERLG